MPFIDHYIIDIKDVNTEIYHEYTGGDNTQVLDNLKRLLSEGLADRITVRVPHIPGYNTLDDITRSKAVLADMGLVRIDEFTYKKR